MKRAISYSKTLKTIRQLPLEVSFDQVKFWVEQHPLSQGNTTLNWWVKLKNWFN